MKYGILYRICIKLPVFYSYCLHNLLTSTSDVTSANFDHLTQQYGCAHALAILTLKMTNKNNTQFAGGKKLWNAFITHKCIDLARISNHGYMSEVSL